MKNKKSLIDSAIRYEINFNLDEICEIIENGKFPQIKKSFLLESSIRTWFEDNPAEEEKIQFLRLLGYEI